MTQRGSEPSWSLYVHIGLKEAMSWAVRAFLEDNRLELASRGVSVVRIDPGAIDASVAAAASSSAHTVACAPNLIGLPRAHIESLARAVAERRGRLIAVVVLTSPRLLAVRKHVGRLRMGTTATLSRVRFKAVNFVPALQRWDETIGTENVQVRATRFVGPTSDLIAAVATELGIDHAGLVLPTGRMDTRFTAPTAEALRLVNISLQDLDRRQAKELRRLAARTLADSAAPGDPPVDLPPDVAGRLESSMRPHMARLMGRLPQQESEWLLASPAVPAEPASRDRAESLWTGLRSKPRLADVLPHDQRALITSEERTRQTRDDLVTAWRASDLARASAGAARLREYIEGLPDFRLVGPLPGGPVIPRRLVQYWEPLPPPHYMDDWLSSWSTLGMAGSTRLVTVDEARAVVEDVAGLLGTRALDLTNHPAQRSDLFRYAYLYVHGGWYVDADHEAWVPHDQVLTWPVRHVFVLRKRRFPNGFIGAEPGSEVMHQALLQACANVVESQGRMHTMESTGPMLLTRVVKPYLETAEASAVVLPGGTVFGGLLQTIYGDAEYKVTGHWRDA